MAFAPRDSVFVDETKSRGYILVATASQPGEIAKLNRAVRGLLLPGQRRIHFKKERDTRRRTILSELVKFGPRVTVYSTAIKSDKLGRALTLEALVDNSIEARVERLVLESDESLIVADKRLIGERIRRPGIATPLRFEHVAPHDHPLLWVSDAVAWCLQAGGEWPQRVAPLGLERHHL